MGEPNKDSKKPASSEQSNSKGQQSSGDYPHIPTILQHGAGKDSCIYRGSDKGEVKQ
jgi:hypothetical protein